MDHNRPNKSPQKTDRQFRILSKIATTGMERPRFVLGLTLLVVALAGAFIPGLGISTSRYGMVADDDPYQARLLRFFREFGFPDTPLVVITGNDAKNRRAVVDKLLKRFEAEPTFTGRSMARIGPKEIAEVILFQSPHALTSLSNYLESQADVASVLEGGLPSMLDILEGQLLTMLATRSKDANPESLDQLAHLATILSSHLEGEEPWGQLLTMAQENEDLLAAWGLDSHGYLAGKQDPHHLIVLFPEFKSDNVADLKPVIGKIRAIRDAITQEGLPDGVAIRVTGIPALTVDELEIIELGVLQSTAMASLGILLLLLLAFRSLRLAILALLPLGLGTVLALAAVRILYSDLNLITSNFMAIILGLGIDFSVHGLARYREAFASGASRQEAILVSMRQAGPGIVTGAITTALAFLTITTTDFTAYAELGVIASIGLVAILAATIFLMPPLLAHTGSAQAERAQLSSTDPCAPWVRLIAARPGTLAAAGILIAILGGLMLPKLQFNVRYFDFLPQHTESAIALDALERDGAMTPAFATLTADGVEAARKKADHLRALPTVGSVHTATDLLPKLSQAELADLRQGLRRLGRDPNLQPMVDDPPSAQKLADQFAKIAGLLKRIGILIQLSGDDSEPAFRASDAFEKVQTRLIDLPDDGEKALMRLAQMLHQVIPRALGTARKVAKRGSYDPNDIPAHFQRRFVSKNGERLALYAFPKGNIWDQKVAKKFNKDVTTLDPEASGLAITLHVHSAMVLDGFRQAAAMAALLVLLVLLWDFGNLRDALLAAVPVGLGWFWMLGIMATFDLSFNVANIVVLPLLLGISIDSGVHMIHRYRESAAAHGGVASLYDVVQGTGRAVVIASSTTMVGFAGLMIADYRAMFSLGLLMVIGIAASLVASLIVLPAVLVKLGLAQGEKI